MERIGIITDDMTGTMTCGVLLAKKGISACSYFSGDDLRGAEEQEALILSANSRNLSKEDAQAHVRSAYHALAQRGAKYFTKRIDTTFRGGMGYEVDALLDELPDDAIAVMAATMPDTRRIVVGGYSVIDNVVLTETGAGRDVLSPVKEAHIPTLMQSQSRRKVGAIYLQTVLSGEEALRTALEQQKADGNKIIVIDAVSTEHLHRIAQTVHNLGWNTVCVDPGAFTQQMALCRGFGHPDRVPEGQKEQVDIPSCSEKVLVVAGSATEVTRRQIEKLAQSGYAADVSIHAGELIDRSKEDNPEIRRSIEEANRYLHDETSRVVVLETASTGERLVLQDWEKKLGLPSRQASANINLGLGAIVRGIAFDPANKDKISGIYMTGGDTLVTVLKALGAAGIRLVDTVQPQTNLGRIIGGDFDGVRIVGKGGLIGDDETAVRVVSRLYYELQKNR
ncbi:four-carbon acid sugar kinase family protein [Clostridium sp. KNHs216]|uniref:four-carbon acid sugar kinase family protein n=1 Tax=Clostridium sp. KNHs216 TaxID=1550235 RepID=UPI00115168E7|nr:four-carbon acid sugar kinase family protein [Clostridium sp. KNHs216]TQI67770.1 uncharacterized protein YgbK (DUF1537 family) [Clostridium sp. KNHs216]